MASLKLGRLPNRTPIKLSISVLPDLHERLEAYAALYASIYGIEEPVSELVPAILDRFLESDREFQRNRHVRRDA